MDLNGVTLRLEWKIISKTYLYTPRIERKEKIVNLNKVKNKFLNNLLLYVIISTILTIKFDLEPRLL